MSKRVLSSVLFALVNSGFSHAAENRTAVVSASDVWQRDDRAFVYQHDGRTRYPSSVRMRDGRMLVLLTRQTKDQEKQETGDLVLVPRSPNGKGWIRPRVVFSGTDAVPRAAGTMTELTDGRIIVPFVLFRNGQTESSLRVLESTDGGQTWSASGPIKQNHLAWAAPNGRPFELGGEILMPIFGALTEDDLAKTRHSCGLLRSEDGGKTWTGWSLITSGSSGAFSFEYPGVLPLGGDKLVAVLTARRLAHGMQAPQVLMRCYSHDGGRTWTRPEQLCVGSWPSLAAVGKDTVVCAYSSWCPWGEMRLLVSQDGLETFTQDQTFVEHGWLVNMGRHPRVSLYPDKELVIEKGRQFWAYHPVPLPPIVPHLGGDWGCGHFGFPSVLVLSDRRLVVVMGNTQRESGYTVPSAQQKIPLEHERIEAIGFDRLTGGSQPKMNRVRSRGRWALAESWTPQKWSQVVLGGAGGYDAGGAIPTEFVSPPLKSGRLIKITSPPETSDFHSMKFIGRERGYWVMHHERHITMPRPQLMYSDDEGKTWREGKLTEPSPVARLYAPFGQIIEGDDGTVVAVFYGYCTEQDMVDHCYSSAIVRSGDEGETWGDWSIIGRDPNRIFSYCEPTVLASPDGVWVTLMRTETPANQPWMAAMISRAVSLDQGRTWSQPKATVVGSQPAAVVLPGGELAFVVRSTGRQNSSVYFSRDLGETWDYALEGAYNTSMAGLLDEKTFWVWANNEALIYKRLDE